jgi:peptidoglycan/xylan/chitin deacetylase (PgdA/CDA1 family)
MLTGAAQAFPLRMFSRLLAPDVVAFCYHAVSEQPLPHVTHIYRHKTPEQFRNDLDFIRSEFNVVSYDDLRTTASSGRGRDRRKKALVTFDDGLAECDSVVRPLLLSQGVPATFFITTTFVGNQHLYFRHKVSLCIDACLHLDRAALAAVSHDAGEICSIADSSPRKLMAWLQSAAADDEPAIDWVCERLGIDPAEFLARVKPYLTTAQIRALAADGFSIGAHGITHARLGTCPDGQKQQEILDSCAEVAAMVGKTEIPFAFPFNGLGVNRDLLESLRRSHTGIGVLFDTRLFARDRNFIINRVVVDEPTGTEPRSNLPMHLRRAYVAASGHAVIGLMTRRGVSAT